MTDTAAPSQAAGLESLPRTTQGWIPITHFNKAHFYEGEDFIVWLTANFAPGDYLIHTAQWSVDEPNGPIEFIGDWRYVPELRHLEPIAFQPMPKPGDWSELMPMLAKAA